MKDVDAVAHNDPNMEVGCSPSTWNVRARRVLQSDRAPWPLSHWCGNTFRGCGETVAMFPPKTGVLIFSLGEGYGYLDFMP